MTRYYYSKYKNWQNNLVKNVWRLGVENFSGDVGMSIKLIISSITIQQSFNALV